MLPEVAMQPPAGSHRRGLLYVASKFAALAQHIRHRLLRPCGVEERSVGPTATEVPNTAL